MASTKAKTKLEGTDLIIVFNYKSKGKSKSVEYEQIQAEYIKLISRLERSGFSTITRANSGDDSVLILVKLDQSRLLNELRRERENDFVHGVTLHLNSDRITSAERIRLTYAILTSPVVPLHPSLISLYPDNSAGITSNEFTHVETIFPPHHYTFNQGMKQRWMTSRRSIPKAEMTLLRNHFGNDAAAYFEFIRFDIFAMRIPAVLGALFYLSGFKYHPLYSILLVIWSIYFVEALKLSEQRFAIENGSHACERVELPRKEYVQEVVIQGKEEVEEVDSLDWIQSVRRHTTTFPIVLLFVILLSILVTAIYVLETLITESYSGPLKQFLTLLPTVLFIGLVPIMLKVWHGIAIKLCNYENPMFKSEFETSLTFKLFGLTFISSYLNLFLTSFVNIPFGAHLLPSLLNYLPPHELLVSSDPLATFTSSTSRLHALMISYTLTGQISGAFVEFLLPILTRFLSKEVVKAQEKRSGKEKTIEDLPEEREYLERVREESKLPSYDVKIDILEMCTQFGYVVLWSSIWPLAPLMAWINNIFEIRTDAYKLLFQTRRPIPTRSCSIGPFVRVLSVLSYIAAITNAGLVHLLRPRLIDLATATPEFITSLFLQKNGTTNSTTSPMVYASRIESNEVGFSRSVLTSTFIFCIVTSQAYFITRAVIRYVLRHVNTASMVEREFRRNGIRIRKEYLNMSQTQEDVVVSAMETADGEADGDEWEKESVEKGLELVKRKFKVE